MVVDAVDVEVRTGQDGQGAPSYDTPVEIDARVVEEEDVARNADGVEVRTTLTVFVDPDQSVIPAEQDRLTWPAGGADTFIVVARSRPRRILGDGAVDHAMLKCREE